MNNRYLLFCCPQYYPSGGMGDCELKTDNLDDIMAYLEKHYKDRLFYHFHYYDIVEDKIMYAVIEEYVNEKYFTRYRFAGWSEERQ